MIAYRWLKFHPIFRSPERNSTAAQNPVFGNTGFHTQYQQITGSG